MHRAIGGVGEDDQKPGANDRSMTRDAGTAVGLGTEGGFGSRSASLPGFVAPVAESRICPGFGGNCDIDASGINPNSNILATTSDNLEITSKFLLHFNRFGRTMGNQSGRSA